MKKHYFFVVLLLLAMTVGGVQASWWAGWFRDMPVSGSIDIAQDNNNVIVTMGIPSDVDSDNIVVDIKGQTLHVYGKSESKQEVSEEGFYKKEISSASFNRSVALPCFVDEYATKAELSGNMLVITMPKLKEEDKAAKKIKVVRT